MAVHNGERYLKKALGSVFRQSFADFEFLAIDDGSTDRTLKILQQARQRDGRLLVIEQQNQGLTRSLNCGLAMAKGDFVARMDADDVCHPDRFARQIEFLDENPDCVAVGSEVMMIDPEGWPIAPRRHALGHDEIDSRLMWGDGGAMTHPAVTMRASAIKEIGGYRDEFHTTQDLDLFLRLAEVGTLHNLPDVLLEWRQHGASVNHTKSHTWFEMKRRALTDASVRRGMHVDIEAVLSRDIDFGRDMRLRWALSANASGMRATALKNCVWAMCESRNYRQYSDVFKDILLSVARQKLERARQILGIC